MKTTVMATVAALIAAAALAASVQCRGTTKRGARCKNKTTDPSGYCHLHKGKAYRHAPDAATNAVPRYETLKSERADVGMVKRLKIWVSVPDGLTTGQVARVMAALIHENTDMHAVSVFVMRDGERPDIYTVGKCDWAPHGDWSKARDGLADPHRETYTVAGDFRARYFSGVPRPTLYGLSARDVATIASEWRAEANREEDALWNRPQRPDRAAIRTAEDRAAATVARRHKLTPAQVKEIFEAYNSDALRCANPGMKD